MAEKARQCSHRERQVFVVLLGIPWDGNTSIIGADACSSCICTPVGPAQTQVWVLEDTILAPLLNQARGLLGVLGCGTAAAQLFIKHLRKLGEEANCAAKNPGPQGFTGREHDYLQRSPLTAPDHHNRGSNDREEVTG